MGEGESNISLNPLPVLDFKISYVIFVRIFVRFLIHLRIYVQIKARRIISLFTIFLTWVPKKRSIASHAHFNDYLTFITPSHFVV